MAFDPNEDPAITVGFQVTVGKMDFGTFTSCEGLGFEVTVEQREEGGNNSYVHQLPGRMKFTNIKLTRPVTKDSPSVAAWVAKMVIEPTRYDASITAMSHHGQVVATYHLMGVIPVKWTGPQLNVDSPKVATETFELAHHGFAPGLPSPMTKWQEKGTANA